MLILSVFSFSPFLFIFFISNLLYFSVKKFFTVFFVAIIFGFSFIFFLELLIFFYLHDPTLPSQLLQRGKVIILVFSMAFSGLKILFLDPSIDDSLEE